MVRGKLLATLEERPSCCCSSIFVRVRWRRPLWHGGGTGGDGRARAGGVVNFWAIMGENGGSWVGDSG